MAGRRRRSGGGGPRYRGAGGGGGRARRGGRSDRPERGGAPGGRGRRDDHQPAPTGEPRPYQPPPPEPTPPELEPTQRTFRGLRLYPFQVAAVDAVESGHTVLVSAPTGSGKTLVADYAIEKAFEHGWRAVYTSPIKALSNQKYRDFRAQHGEQVGIMTGDVTLNPDADLLIMTTEVFRNTLFDEPERLRDFRFVIHDEVHYLDDPERGTVWEESIIHAPPQMRLVCLSATIPNVRELSDWIASVRGEEVTVVEMTRRPVPLDHLVWLPDHGPVKLDDAAKELDRPYRERRGMRRERAPTRLLDWLGENKLLPVLFFCFSRKECERLAGDNRSRALLEPARRNEMQALFDDLVLRYECQETKTLARLREMALSGVAYHHAGMLPVHKEIVERLFTSGLVRMLFATETFALGVNMPARTVAFAMLRKFDGEKMDYMLCRSYGQMAGRAGRQGIDDHGLVVSMVDPVMDRPPGVRRVLTGEPEPVLSRWNPDYSSILSLYPRLGDRVLDTYEKSFARFQRERRRGRASPGRSDEQRVLAARLAILKSRGYVEEGRLTDKGRFTSQVNGYEVPAAEYREAGLLDRLEGFPLAALLLATVYEPRLEDTSRPPRDRSVMKVAEEAVELVSAFRAAEFEAGLVDVVREPHFGLSGVLEEWMRGAPLAHLPELTTVGEGDVVRNFRLLLQYARQVRKAVPQHEGHLRRRLDAVMDAVNRDEVDARRQLELGQDPTAAGDEEGEDEPPGEDAAEPELDWPA